MVIVAGHITVEPQQRESYLAGCVSVVERTRGTAGCLDLAITADLIDPGRVNICGNIHPVRPPRARSSAGATGSSAELIAGSNTHQI
jgi:hypothetical protein